jgi:predicted  nucleic acid-binding Zn ribbon protein
MHTFNITIENKNPSYLDLENDLCSYLSILTNSGQIAHNQFDFLATHKSKTTVAVACPELDSLDDKYTSVYGLSLKTKIESGTGNKIKSIKTGAELEDIHYQYQTPVHSSHYILRQGWSSPLLCGDTHKPIPLYKIPYTGNDKKSYDNVWSWQRHYAALYRLWLASQPVAEAFALGQIQEIDSESSLLGRELCTQIEELTGVPTYYFLFNYRNWSVEEDFARKCPITNQHWLLAGKTANDFIAFKCDDSRLVSELSHNCEEAGIDN